MNYTALILTILGIVATYFICCLIGAPLSRYAQIEYRWYHPISFITGITIAVGVTSLIIIISSIYVWISSFV